MEQNCLIYLLLIQMRETTEDGSLKVLLQILYGQYLILGAFGSYIHVLDLKTTYFCRKKNQLHFPMDKCQNSADSYAKNTPKASKYFSQICLPKLKSFEFLKKKISLGVRSPCKNGLKTQKN